MAIRSRYLGPDEVRQCVGGLEIPVVSRQAIVDAAVEAIIAQELNGGIVTIVTGRLDTGFPNEKVTAEAVVSWQDRGAAKPQPEPEEREEVLVLAVPREEEQDVVEQTPDAPVEGADVQSED